MDIGDLVTYSVKVAGTAIPDEYSVLSVRITQRVNRIPTAVITLLDGSADDGTFKVSSADTFVPGAAVSIEVGYDNLNKVLFKGIVTRQSIQIDDVMGSTLRVECRDAAVKMIVGRKSLSWANTKDSDIISSIIGTYSGLSPKVTSTDTTWPEQIQYYCTDWDYILTRAEANGMLVIPVNGTVSVAPPDASTQSVGTYTYGDGLLSFHADLDAVTQIGAVQASSWDFTTQVVSSTSTNNSYKGPGNLSCTQLSQVLGLTDFNVQSTAPLQTADLTAWSKAQLMKSSFSKIMGSFRVLGTNDVVPGVYVTLSGLGDRFNGDHLVSEVEHLISDGNWVTEMNIGLSANWFSEEPDLMSPPASGLLPGARGLFNGTVKKMYEDPDSQYRILVEVPLFDANGTGVWARLSTFYATSGAGAFFLPEVGDEVILGFLNEDPRYPVILGSLYSASKLKPFQGLDPNQNNQIKAIVSKSGINIEFDDTDKVLTIATPDKNTIIFSDKDKKITVQDENGNSMVMSSDGIAIKSPKNISLTADGQVSISGTQGVSVKASGGDVSISGMNIKEKADMQYSAEGSQMAQINSGMELTLKSAMIMIN
jgi:Rhs element Vgr protein